MVQEKLPKYYKKITFIKITFNIEMALSVYTLASLLLTNDKLSQ